MNEAEVNGHHLGKAQVSLFGQGSGGQVNGMDFNFKMQL